MRDSFWDDAAHGDIEMPFRHVPTVWQERLVTGAAGAALVWFGLARRGVIGSLAAATGSALLIHGLAPRTRTCGLLGVEPNSHRSASINSPIHFRETMTVGVEPGEAYRRWRRLEDLPSFMRKVESVEVLDERRSRWTVTGPGGRSLEWEAEIVEERAGEYLAWQTTDQGVLEHEGSVRFLPAPGDRGTRVLIEMTCHPRGGVRSAAALKMPGSDPRREAREGLRRFKQLLEAGEIADGASPSARDEIHHRRLDDEHRRFSRHQTARESRAMDEALIGTFPASDPPSFMPGTA